MPEWMVQLVGPALGGALSGIMILAGLRVEVKALRESVAGAVGVATRAHVRLDDHIDRQHVRGAS